MSTKMLDLFSKASFLELIQKGIAEGALPVASGGQAQTPLLQTSTMSAAPGFSAIQGSVMSAAVTVKAPQGGSGGGWDDSEIKFTPTATLYVGGKVRSTSDFAGGRYGIVNLDAGESGHLVVSVRIEGVQDNILKNDYWEQKFSVEWKISADAEGKLTFGTAQVFMPGPEKNDTDYTLVDVKATNDPSAVYVTPVIVGSADTSSKTGGVSVDGKIVGGEIGSEKSKQKAAPPTQAPFQLDIKVKVPDPKGTVEIGDTVTMTTPSGKFEYTIGPFKVGSANVIEGGTIKKNVYFILHEQLPPEVKDEIINGELPGGVKIEVEGYTSNTDSENRNFNLPMERAKVVLAEFQSLGVPAKVFSEPISHGEWQTSVPTDDKQQEKEDSEWRKVVLKVKYEMTFKTNPKTGEMERVK